MTSKYCMLQVQNVKKVLDYKCKLTVQISLSLCAGLCYRTIRYHNNTEVHNWTCLTDQLLNRMALKAKKLFHLASASQNYFSFLFLTSYNCFPEARLFSA